jgi:hypothetical protein
MQDKGLVVKAHPPSLIPTHLCSGNCFGLYTDCICPCLFVQGYAESSWKRGVFEGLILSAQR